MKQIFAATWRLFALVLVGVLPFLILAGIVGWHDIIKVAVYGFFVTMIATVIHGTRGGVMFALIFAAFAGVGAAVQHSVIGLTILIGLSAALIPVLGAYGYVRASIFAAMFIPNAVNPAPQPWDQGPTTSLLFIGAVAGITLLGAAWGLFIGQAVGKNIPPRTPTPAIPARAAAVGGVMLVAVAGVITYISVTNFPQAKWAWLLGAIYSMMLAVTGVSWKTSWQLILGTFLGSLGAVLVLFLNPPTSPMVLVGTFLMAGSIALNMMGKPYWLAMGVSTAGVIFLTGSSMDPFLAAEDRLIFTAIGSIVALALGIAITSAVRLQEERDDTAPTPAT